MEMAIAALDCHPRPSPMDDPDLRHVDSSPVSLDLTMPDGCQDAGAEALRGGTKDRSSRRKSRPTLDSRISQWEPIPARLSAGQWVRQHRMVHKCWRVF